MTIDVKEAISKEEIKNLLNAFTKSTGLWATFYSHDLSYVILPDDQKAKCTFCNLIQSCKEGQTRCNAFRKKSGRQSADLGESYIARCHAGLIVTYVPVLYQDNYLGFITCGPVMMWEWDAMAVEEFMRKTRELNLSESQLLTASRMVKTFTSTNVKAAADLLYMAVTHIASEGMHELKQRKKAKDRQARIAERIMDKKHGSPKDAEKKLYPIEKERELLSKVKIGDRTEANAILNDILGDIFFSNAGNTNMIKARLLELIAVISRAAVEAGASMPHMLSITHQTLTELIGVNAFETMCRWITDSLNRMMDTIYETRNVKNSGTLSTIMEYMRNNYDQNLTLDQVAKAVYLSPYYISHLFKEQLDITFIGYLTRIRIEESKTLLKDKSITVAAIANAVGYDDPGYFSKVFKKYTGMTPKKFREH